MQEVKQMIDKTGLIFLDDEIIVSENRIDVVYDDGNKVRWFINKDVDNNVDPYDLKVTVNGQQIIKLSNMDLVELERMIYALA